MNKFFLNIAVGVLALFAMSTSAQAQNVPVFVGTTAIIGNVRQTLFGTPNVNLGVTTIQTFDSGFPVGTLTYRVRECANNQAWQPLDNFKLVTDLGMVQGVKSYLASEYVVSFTINSTIPTYSSRSYSMYADIGSFPPGFTPDVNQECFRMSLERSGVQFNKYETTRSEPIFTGNFPIRLQAHTLLTTKPTVTVTTLGQTSNRVRTVADNVFLLRVANGPANLWIKDIALKFSGATLPIGFGQPFELIDSEANIVIAKGELNWIGNVRWEQVGNGNGVSWESWVIQTNNVRNLIVRVNSSNFLNTANQDSFSIQLVNPCDLRWDTSVANQNGPGLCLETQAVPITSTVSYE